MKYHWIRGHSPNDPNFEWLWCEHCSKKLHISDLRICEPEGEFCSVRCAVMWAGHIFHTLTVVRTLLGKYTVRPSLDPKLVRARRRAQHCREEFQDELREGREP